MTEKVELKLIFAPDYTDRLRHHPVVRALKQRRAVTKHITTTYYDTPNFALYDGRILFYIMRVGRKHLQAVRRDPLPGIRGSVIGEWEHFIDGDTPDLSRVDEPKLRALLEPVGASGELKPIFATVMTRWVWPLKIDNTEIICALNIGEISANGLSHPLCEVELQFKAGQRSNLYELARRLSRTVPLQIERATRAEHGYRLVAGLLPKPEFAKRVRLYPNMTVRMAFTRIVRACIEHIVANVDCTHHDSDPEGLHQLRVGIRRLRAALFVFRDVIPEQDWLSLSSELRWLQQELGPAREWDVLLKETLTTVAKQFEVLYDMRQFEALAEGRRVAAYERTRNALNDPRYTDLLLRLEGWIEGENWHGAPTGLEQATGAVQVPPAAAIADTSLPASANENVFAEQSEPSALERPISAFAAEVLGARHIKVRKLGQRVRNLNVEQVHRLRIRVKKLRYATEFFRDLAPKKAVKQYVVALKRLQEALGAVQDAVAADSLVRALATEAAPKIEREAGLLEGWIAANLVHDRKKLSGFWRDFSKHKPFWVAE